MIDGALALLSDEQVRHAVGRLVSGIADLPLAYWERWTEGVRSDTAARKAVTSAVATAVAATAAQDSAIINRGLDRWTRQLGARQESREKVAIATLDILDVDGRIGSRTAPSEDFMRAFEDIAEKASSEEVIDLMARILAGEIRRPGSVSRRTLAVVPTFDLDIISALAFVQPYLLEGLWFCTPPTSESGWRERLALLASVSITSEIEVRSLSWKDGVSQIRMLDKAIVCTAKQGALSQFFDGAHVTPIGRELLSLLPLRTESKTIEVARGLKELSFIKQVSVWTIAYDDGATLSLVDEQVVS